MSVPDLGAKTALRFVPPTLTRPIDDVLSRLPNYIRTTRGYRAHCPAHEDRKPSLSITEGSDGAVLLRCFAGCDVESIVSKLGMNMRDLFPQDRYTSNAALRSRGEHQAGNGTTSHPSDRKYGRVRPFSNSVGSKGTRSGVWVETTYNYRDASGATIAIKKRKDVLDAAGASKEKSFAWYTPEGYRGNRSGLPFHQSALPLYHLPELLASPNEDFVLFVEGEKASDAALARGFVSVSLPGGAGQRDFGNALSALSGRRVVLCPDNDDAGVKFMRDYVAPALEGIVSELRWLEIPGLPGKGDVADYFALADARIAAAGDPCADFSDEPALELRALAQSAPLPPAATTEKPPATDMHSISKSLTGEAVSTPSKRDAEATSEKEAKKSQAQLLIEMVLADCELFHDETKEVYANITVGEHIETCELKSTQFREWLALEFYERAQRTAAPQSIAEATSMLKGIARNRCGMHPYHLRIGGFPTGHGPWESIYVDLGHNDWEIVEIDQAGWRIIPYAKCPVRFRRANGMLALPKPERGGSIQELRKFVHVGSETDWVLILAFLLSAYRPSGPYPVLPISAEQGSAKTSLTRVIKRLVDPNSCELRSEPHDVHALMVGARNTWMLSYDNISHIEPWLSDAFCRLSTGGGFAKRQLYEDTQEIIINIQRPLLLNGIEDMVVRGDLIDRSILVTLPRIPNDKRMDEQDFWRLFASAAPRLLGAIYEVLSTILRELPQVRSWLTSLPRMADMALWVSAAEPALGLSRGAFLSTYDSNRAGSDALVLESTTLARVFTAFVDEIAANPTATTSVYDLIEPEEGEGAVLWSGTASMLLEELTTRVDDETRRHRSFPKQPNSFSNSLRRFMPSLRSSGKASLSFTRARDGKRQIVIRKVLGIDDPDISDIF